MKTSNNSTYPKVAVQWLNQSLCFYQSLCFTESEVLRNWQLTIPPNVMDKFKKTHNQKLIKKI